MYFSLVFYSHLSVMSNLPQKLSWVNAEVKLLFFIKRFEPHFFEVGCLGQKFC